MNVTIKLHLFEHERGIPYILREEIQHQFQVDEMVAKQIINGSMCKLICFNSVFSILLNVLLYRFVCKYHAHFFSGSTS